MEGSPAGKTSEIGAAMEEQIAQLDRLHELVEETHQRLGRVLRFSSPSLVDVDAESKVREEEGGVPLANEIRANTSRIRGINTKLSKLMELCDL